MQTTGSKNKFYTNRTLHSDLQQVGNMFHLSAAELWIKRGRFEAGKPSMQGYWCVCVCFSGFERASRNTDLLVMMTSSHCMHLLTSVCHGPTLSHVKHHVTRQLAFTKSKAAFTSARPLPARLSPLHGF